MNNDSRRDRYWRQFKNSRSCPAYAPDGYHEAFKIGSTESGAEEGAKLILDGTKTASGSLASALEHDGKAMPQPGDMSIVLDGSDLPVCIVETTRLDIVPYDEVDPEYAFAGGKED